MKSSFAWDINPWVWAITFRIAEGPLPEGRRERPILFRGELVRAILEGRKTQTRRPVKLPSPDGEVYIDPGGTIFGPGPYVKNYKAGPDADPPMHPRILCPYGYPGDRLWVREAFTHITGNGIRVHYRADGEPTDRDGNVLPTEPGLCRWWPSIHMPRSASRLSLEVVSVRVERLHAITEEDARAEGVEPVEIAYFHEDEPRRPDSIEHSYREGFARKWREIHDKATRARRAAEARAA